MKLKSTAMRITFLAGFMCAFLWGSAQQDSQRDLRGRVGNLLSKGRVADAERLVHEELARHPQSAELHAQLGMLHYQLMRYERAIEELGRAVQLDGNNAEYAMNLADVLLASRRFAVAVDFLLAVKRRFSSLSQYQYNLGLAYYGVRNFTMALVHFQNAAKLAPSLDLAYYFQGNCLAAIGDLKRAENAYRTALKLQPKHADYLFALGKVLSLEGPGHDAEAIALLQAALKSRPDHTPSRFYLGLAYERSGRLSQALELLEAVAREHQDQIEPHVALARIYYRLRQREKGDEASRTVKRLRERSQGQPLRPSPFQNGVFPEQN